jgi:hypothetical protein
MIKKPRWMGVHWTDSFCVILVDFSLHIFRRYPCNDISPAVEIAIGFARLEQLRNAVDMDTEPEGDSHALGTCDGQF